MTPSRLRDEGPPRALDQAARAAIARADGELRAALVLLDDRSTPPELTTPHLDAARAALRSAGAPLDLDDARVSPTSVFGERSRLRREARLLTRALRQLDPTSPLPARELRRRDRLWLNAIAAFFLLGATGYELSGRPNFRAGRWSLTYYLDPELQEPVATTRLQDASIDWAKQPPPDALAEAHRFSARFETCLVVEEPLPIAWSLVTGAGVRLRLNDEVVLDGWSSRRQRAHTASSELAPGTYHLVLEATVRSSGPKGKELDLRASLAGAKPVPLPESMLRVPATDSAQPCASE